MIRLRIEDSCCTRLLFDWQVEKWENLVRFQGEYLVSRRETATE